MIRFNYTSYDPSITVIDIYFDSTENPGKLDLFCNYRKVSAINVNKETKKMTLNLVSFSGVDWVEPMTSMFGLNEMVFESNINDGYEGTFRYQITFRGSR